MTVQFKKLGIREALCEVLHKDGITRPTPVQLETIPLVLKGEDVIAQAQTGTGKTLAFVLPLLERITPGSRHTQALIMTPTRELAIQITKEIKPLAEAIGCNVLAAYGGQDVETQIRKLNGESQIVVGTPGRLLDHLRRGTLTCRGLSVLVLDEADQMLQMGFLNEVEEVIDQTSSQRQTLLFSATMPDGVKQLAARYMKQPQDVRIRSEQITVKAIDQFVVEVSDRGKLETLVSLVRTVNPYLAVVFCRTKQRAKNLAASLLEQGLAVDELHGDLSQAKREQVMKRFRMAKLQVLVATDVAARGLDVEGVTHVINYDIPHDAESYIHRTGRTGRAGQAGTAITFAAPRDRMTLQAIEQGIQARLPRQHMSQYGVGTAPVAQASAASDRAQPQRRNARSTDKKGPRDGGRRASGGRKATGGRKAPDNRKAPGDGQSVSDGSNSAGSEWAAASSQRRGAHKNASGAAPARDRSGSRASGRSSSGRDTAREHRSGGRNTAGGRSSGGRDTAERNAGEGSSAGRNTAAGRSSAGRNTAAGRSSGGRNAGGRDATGREAGGRDTAERSSSGRSSSGRSSAARSSDRRDSAGRSSGEKHSSRRRQR